MPATNPLVEHLRAQIPASTDPERLRRWIEAIEEADKLEMPEFLKRGRQEPQTASGEDA